MKKAIGKRLLALLLVVLMLCPQTYALAATDLSGHWCRGEIEAFLSKDLVRGYPDGGFHPDATVTRAEFIRMVNSTFGFVREGTATFTDVKEGDWYSADLAAAARTGWFSGMPDGSALPQATITRQEAAKLLVSMLGEKRPGSFAMFTDGRQVADWARDYVETAGALGIIEGFPDGTYRPTRYLTRAETVKMLSNIAQQIYSAAGIYHTDRVERSAVVLCGGSRCAARSSRETSMFPRAARAASILRTARLRAASSSSAQQRAPLRCAAVQSARSCCVPTRQTPRSPSAAAARSISSRRMLRRPLRSPQAALFTRSEATPRAPISTDRARWNSSRPTSRRSCAAVR